MLGTVDEQWMALGVSQGSREADRARAVLLTQSDWSSPRIAEAFGVRGGHASALAQRFWPRRCGSVEGERRAWADAAEEQIGVARGHALA